MVGDWDWVVVGDDLIAQVILKDLTQNIGELEGHVWKQRGR